MGVPWQGLLQNEVLLPVQDFIDATDLLFQMLGLHEAGGLAVSPLARG